MRLKTLSNTLADRFSDCNDVGSAKALFIRIFWFCFNELDARVKKDLFENDDLSCLEKHEFPISGKLQALRNEFDNKYFDAEDLGDLKTSDKYFKVARLVSSMEQQARASEIQDFSEAAYEALMSLDDPKDAVNGILASI